jgi:hypothetical protein
VYNAAVPGKEDFAFGVESAAQLVEQLKHANTSELKIRIKDSTGEWLVTAKLLKNI